MKFSLIGFFYCLIKSKTLGFMLMINFLGSYPDTPLILYDFKYPLNAISFSSILNSVSSLLKIWFILFFSLLTFSFVIFLTGSGTYEYNQSANLFIFLIIGFAALSAKLFNDFTLPFAVNCIGLRLGL